jgi:hypothetical protein
MTYDVLAIGRSSIDLYAHEIGRPIADVRSFDAYVGGCPTNVSVGTRRLGLRSALLTAIGDDQVGDFVTAFLERELVETRFIPRKPGRRTSAVILTIQPPDNFRSPSTATTAPIALDDGDVARAPVADSGSSSHRNRPQSRARTRAHCGGFGARAGVPWWSTSTTGRSMGRRRGLRVGMRCCSGRRRSRSAQKRALRPRPTMSRKATTLLAFGSGVDLETRRARVDGVPPGAPVTMAPLRSTC